MREIIFDTETTGLSPEDGDRIIEIGAVEMINGMPTGKTFHHYLNPGDRKIDKDAEAVHGINNEQLKDKPAFVDIINEFNEFFLDSIIVAHNASFDMGFINAELKIIGEQPIEQDRVVDTLEIARRKNPTGSNSLDALCKRYNISTAHRKLHGALLDSQLLAEVYMALNGKHQAGLELEETKKPEKIPNQKQVNQNVQPREQRPEPLESRLSEEDKKNHSSFVKESIGNNAIWKKYKIL